MCSETWLDGRYSNDLIQLTGKTCYCLDRNLVNANGNIRGGGVAIYGGNNWANYVTIDRENTFCDADLEIITLHVNKPNHKKMTVSCIYRPPNTNQDNTYNKLSSVMNRISSHNSEIWIAGDFNWDWNRRNHD